MDTYTKLTNTLDDATKLVRETLAENNVGSRFHIKIEVSGSVFEGAPMATFKLGDSEYGEYVAGGDLCSVTYEYMRRKGWKAANAPVMLEGPKRPSEDAYAAAKEFCDPSPAL